MVKEIILSSKEDAEVVLDNMNKLLAQNKMVFVSDLYDLVGLPTTYEDAKVGWYDLKTTQIEEINHEFILKFPPTVEPI